MTFNSIIFSSYSKTHSTLLWSISDNIGPKSLTVNTEFNSVLFNVVHPFHSNDQLSGIKYADSYGKSTINENREHLCRVKFQTRIFDLEINGHIRMNSLKNHLCSTQIKNKFIKNHISFSKWPFFAQTTYWCWPRSRYPGFSKSPRSKNWTSKTFDLGDFVYRNFLPGSVTSVILCIFRDCAQTQKLCYLMWTILFPQQYNQLVAPWSKSSELIKFSSSSKSRLLIWVIFMSHVELENLILMQ